MTTTAGAQTPEAILACAAAVVVTYRSGATIAACIRSIVRGGIAPERIVVVDNDADDATARFLATSWPSAVVVRSRENVGFAAAVNRGVRHLPAACSYLVLVNPDVVLDEHALLELARTACRLPGALVGGLSRDDRGERDLADVLPRPSVRAAARVATGRPPRRRVPRAEVDRVRAAGVSARAVPTLAGSLVLVPRATWGRLGGFDERFWMYGEDVDLCVRARRQSVPIVQAARAGYLHARGTSSDLVDRRVMIAAGSVTLYRRTLPGWRAALAVTCLRSGIAGRAAVDRVPRRGAARGTWLPVWRARARWWHGYPARDGPDGLRPRGSG